MTIAAISTPNAVGGIALIRISGENSIPVAARIFQPFGKIPVKNMPGHTCAYGKIVVNGETLDDVLLTVFRAPKSYTGEDVVEISCHGGIYVSKRILREIYSLGVIPAAPGEFTKRAFLNGKLSLTQAEAVADIISAEGENALTSANLMREGAVFRSAKDISDRLVKVLSSLAAWTDYPDEDLPEADSGEILLNLRECRERLLKLIKDYDAGLIFREGISCAIVGRPNVGKSTLMNALLGYERSIVTKNAGTTRDVVEEKLRLGDVVLKISDTAGIREAGDEAEQIGVRLAERAIDRAQLILAVFDGSEELSEEDRNVYQKVSSRRHIVIINKNDLPQKLDKSYFNSNNILEVEAKTGLGVEKLREAVYDIFKLNSHIGASEVYANERQKQCCDTALLWVGNAIDALSSGETLDAVTVCIDEAAEALLELSGERVTDAVVEDVFSRFCVGK